MKSTILTITFILLSFISNSQVITVYLDTCQYFEHSVLMSTPQAIRSGKLVYKTLYENKPNYVVKFDLNNKIETHSGFDCEIIKINPSSNILDVEVNEGPRMSLTVLGETEEGGVMYIYEYRDGDLMKGFFSKDPAYEIN